MDDLILKHPSVGETELMTSKSQMEKCTLAISMAYGGKTTTIHLSPTQAEQLRDHLTNVLNKIK